MRRAGTIGIHAALAAVVIAFGTPFLWLAALAFDRSTGAAWPWPDEPTLANARALFEELALGQALRNSLLVSGATALLVVALAALACVGRVGRERRGLDVAGYGLLLLYSFPFVATMTPINDLARRLELFNTYPGVILAHVAVALPLAIWLLRGYLDSVPRDLQAAAELDGAAEWRAWRDAVLPQVRPGLAIVFGLSFATSWADVLLTTALVRGQSMATVSLRFATGAQGGLDAPVVAAMGVIYIAPVLAVFLLLRRAIVRSFTGG